MSDIVLIGGGVIGLSIAYELAGQGASVRILDQGPLGQESSWAGAGMISPGNPTKARSLEAKLKAESFVRWPDWSARLHEETGIDNGFSLCGAIEFSPSQSSDELHATANEWQADGIIVQELASRELHQLEPNLHPELDHAIHLPQAGQVRNPRHVKALINACLARGVQLSPGTPVFGFEGQRGRINAIHTVEGTISADQFVVCSGAWSKSVLAQANINVEIEPLRGQIVLLNAPSLPIRRVIEVGPRYLVPRSDGRILIGSTEEHVGFDKSNTAAAIGDLTRFASDLVPTLKTARFERCWSGLRPMSRTGLPYLGRVPNSENLFVAAGHFRLGLTLSPITAVLLRQMLLNQSLTIEWPAL